MTKQLVDEEQLLRGQGFLLGDQLRVDLLELLSLQLKACPLFLFLLSIPGADFPVIGPDVVSLFLFRLVFAPGSGSGARAVLVHGCLCRRGITTSSTGYVALFFGFAIAVAFQSLRVRLRLRRT